MNLTRSRFSRRALLQKLTRNAQQAQQRGGSGGRDHSSSIREPEVVNLSCPCLPREACPAEERLIVHYRPDAAALVAARAMQVAAASAGGQVVSQQPLSCRTAVVRGCMAESLRSCKHVGDVEPDLRVRLQSTQVLPWSMRNINAPFLRLRRPVRPVNADVFVFDTGVAQGHRDLHVVRALSFVQSERTPWDLNGHGTAVAGVIGARDNGVDIVGVAPGVRIHSMKVLDRDGNGLLSDIVAAFEHMIWWKRSMHRQVQNAVVANLSLGAYVGSARYTALDHAIRQATRNGITVVVAAGNEGEDATLYTPAHASEALTVGAADELNRITSWSNWGPAVQMHAPGSNILTTYLQNKLARISGTSFAAPHAAGAAALYLARFRTASPAQVCRQLVQLSARPGVARVNVGERSSTTTLRLDCRAL
jgi:subtilisin family serine protease